MIEASSTSMTNADTGGLAVSRPKTHGRRHDLGRGRHHSACAPANWSLCLAPTAPAKPPCSGALPGWCAQRPAWARVEGEHTAAMTPRRRARQLAYLPQNRPLAWPSPVRDVVALGRFAHGAVLGRLRGADRTAVERALAACDLQQLAGRSTATLSGGELARVHCARAFAAEAPLLIADEPVAELDPYHQFRVMDLIRAFVTEGGGALVVLHDLTLASRYASRLIWMKGGRISRRRGLPQPL